MTTEPTPATTSRYIEAARRIWHSDGEIEIDDDAKISRGTDAGAYVQAWVWVYDDQLETIPGPTYDVWTCEPIVDNTPWGDWHFDQCFTCDDDPDGKGARRSAHEYARYLRNTYPCAYVAVRLSSLGKPLTVRG